MNSVGPLENPNSRLGREGVREENPLKTPLNAPSPAQVHSLVSRSGRGGEVMKMKPLRLLPMAVAVCLGLLLSAFTVFIAFRSASNNLLTSDDPQSQPAGFEGPICMRSPQLELASLAGGSENLFAENLFAESTVARPIDPDLPIPKNVAPLRSIWEPGPNFSGVFVDTAHDEIVAIDNNHNQILTYARLANGLTPPLRTITGLATNVDFPAAVFVDTVKDEIYVVDNEISDRITVHSRIASGNLTPLRMINARLPTSDKRYSGGIMHLFGLWGDPERRELVSTSQIGNNIATWDMNAGTSGIPKRNIQGAKTGLADPRGVSIDKLHGEIIVITDGHRQGGVSAPSIRVFKRDADGDAAPIRVIEGPSTLLEYMGKGLYLDTVNDEIYIATSNNAILVFPRTGSGDIAPTRVLRGRLTGLDHPTGVFVDTEHNETVVSNWENFSITVYPRTANGDVAPIRTIRASGDPLAVGLLRGRAIALDRVNDEIWHLN